MGHKFKTFHVVLDRPGVFSAECDQTHETVMAYDDKTAVKEALRRHPELEIRACQAIKLALK